MCSEVVLIEGAKANKHSKGGEDILCCIKVPNALLYSSHLENSTSYIDTINAKIDGRAITLNVSANRLERRLSVKAGILSSQIRRKSGRARDTLKSKFTRFDIYKDEVLVHLQQTNDITQSEMKKKEQTIQSLQKIIKRKDDSLRTSVPNLGKGLEEVEMRQRRRKIAVLKESCKNALWFTDTYDIDLVNISFKTPCDETVVLNYSSQPPATSSTANGSIDEVLYLLDCYGVSDQFYHELSVLFPNLPRSYLVKEERSRMILNTEVKSLPPPYSGYYLPFEKLLTDKLNSYDMELNKVEVKISGDGAPFSRLSSFILLSYSLPSLEESLSSKSNYTIAIIKGKESYDVMKEGFAPVIEEINGLVKKGFLIIRGKEVQLTMYFGGDYKFILMSMGMKEANSNNSCLYCEIHKNNRWDTTHIAKQRSLCSIQKQVAKKECGVSHEPLFNIELSNVVVDELHMFLRITDVLLRNLLWEMIYQDESNVFVDKESNYINSTVDAIQSCGLTFQIWKTDKKRGKEGYDWTSLRGNDKKTLMQRLPSKIPALLPRHGNEVMKLWEEFYLIYNIISTRKPSNEDITIVERKTKEWIQQFTALGTMQGYQKSNVTPYMHLFCQHIPQLMTKHKGIKRFSGQGVEKNNDDARRHYQSSNHLNPPKDILLTEARLTGLSHTARTKRHYEKHDSQYWTKGIFTKRAKNDTQQPDNVEQIIEDELITES